MAPQVYGWIYIIRTTEKKAIVRGGETQDGSEEEGNRREGKEGFKARLVLPRSLVQSTRILLCGRPQLGIAPVFFTCANG